MKPPVLCWGCDLRMFRAVWIVLLCGETRTFEKLNWFIRACWFTHSCTPSGLSSASIKKGFFFRSHSSFMDQRFCSAGSSGNSSLSLLKVSAAKTFQSDKPCRIRRNSD